MSNDWIEWRPPNDSGVDRTEVPPPVHPLCMIQAQLRGDDPPVTGGGDPCAAGEWTWGEIGSVSIARYRVVRGPPKDMIDAFIEAKEDQDAQSV